MRSNTRPYVPIRICRSIRSPWLLSAGFGLVDSDGKRRADSSVITHVAVEIDVDVVASIVHAVIVHQHGSINHTSLCAIGRPACSLLLVSIRWG